MGSFLDFVTGALAPVIGVAQQGYNLYKDIFNVDNERSVDASEQLADYNQVFNRENMAAQYQYNRQLAEQTQGYYRENQEKSYQNLLGSMDRANMYYNQNLEHAARLNDESMAKQFAYNQYLGNEARSIFQQRMAGVNPTGSSGSVSSVTALSPSAVAPSGQPTQGGSSGTPSMSLPSLSMSPVARSLYTPSGFNAYRELMEAEKAKAEKSNIDAKTDNQLTANEYQRNRIILELQELKARILKNNAGATNLDANTKQILDTVEYQIAVLKSKNDLQAAQAANTKKQTDLADDYLQVEQQKAAAETTKAYAAQLAAKAQQMGVNIEAEKLQSVISLMSAEADKLEAEAKSENQFREKRKEMIEKSIDKLVADKELSEIQADYLKYQMGKGVFDEIIDAYRDNFPHMNYQDVIETNGVDQRGHKTKRTQSWSRKVRPRR